MTVQRVSTPSEAFPVERAGYEPFGRFRAGDEVVDPTPLAKLLRTGLLCNDARVIHGDDGWKVLGDPTDWAPAEACLAIPAR